MISIDDLIRQMKLFFEIPARITFDLPEYVYFHNQLQEYIYGNHFEETDEWRIISENLVYQSNQCMAKNEANAILVQLDRLKRRVLSRQYDPLWVYVHPRIAKVAMGLYTNGHFANAVEDAFIEINDRVKKIFHIIRPDDQVPDGVAVMNEVFSVRNPIIRFCDLTDDTGKNTQLGYMQMLAGAMSALRNPKAHSNDIVLSKEEAMRRLMYASMLMYKIDEGIRFSGINE